MEQIAKGLLSWASILEDQAREQALRTASLPWIRPHVALMPDAHWGMGSTVGSVIRPPTSSGIRRQPGRDGGPGRRLSRRVYGSDISAEEIITCHHNYTEQEEHFGKKVWLTRKGAINAAEGKRGLIPGSMGTRSYVVTGKGNKASFNSAPHGAGRNFSRSEARKRFTVEELNDAMKGIEWRAGNADAFLDEIPAPTRTWTW